MRPMSITRSSKSLSVKVHQHQLLPHLHPRLQVGQARDPRRQVSSAVSTWTSSSARKCERASICMTPIITRGWISKNSRSCLLVPTHACVLFLRSGARVVLPPRAKRRVARKELRVMTVPADGIDRPRHLGNGRAWIRRHDQTTQSACSICPSHTRLAQHSRVLAHVHLRAP